LSDHSDDVGAEKPGMAPFLWIVSLSAVGIDCVLAGALQYLDRGPPRRLQRVPHASCEGSPWHVSSLQAQSGRRSGGRACRTTCRRTSGAGHPAIPGPAPAWTRTARTTRPR
jgi:hypothetical protein